MSPEAATMASTSFTVVVVVISRTVVSKAAIARCFSGAALSVAKRGGYLETVMPPAS